MTIDNQNNQNNNVNIVEERWIPTNEWVFYFL